MSEAKSLEILDYRNSNGHGWTFYKCDGVLRGLGPGKTPGDDLKTIRKVQNFELRGDDVMIVAVPKSGTHWLWEIVTMIQNGSANYSTNQKEVGMLGVSKFHDIADTLPSPRVLNTHLYFRHLPKNLIEKGVKIIHMIRNPKDVSVSFYNQTSKRKAPFGFGGTYSEFVHLFLDGKVSWGSYFHYIKDWQRVEIDHPQLPILTVYYEHLKKEPVTTIQMIATFLGKTISENLCEEIAEACNFSRLKMADKDVKESAHKTWSELWKDENFSMYRKGEIGDWKNWLTVAQNEQFDDVIEKEMKNTGITFNFE